MSTVSCLSLCYGIVSSWAFTAKLPHVRIRSKSAQGFSHFSATRTVLQSQRSRFSVTRDSEMYFSNSTRLFRDMDLQWNELMNFEDSVSSPSSTEMVPSYDFLPETRAKEKQTPASAEKEGISDLWKARLLLIVAAALYGTNFSLVKLLGNSMPVGVSTTLRFGAASLATSPWLIRGGKDDENALMAAWLGFEVGLWNSIGYVSQAVGLDTTPAAESAFICSLAVVTVPILDFLAGKKLHTRQWVGAALAVIGVALLELVGQPDGRQSLSTGELMTLVQPFAFGFGFWRMESAMHRFPGQAARMTAAQLLAVFMASLAYGLWAIDMPTLQGYPWGEWMTNSSLLFSIFWTGVVTTAMTIYMENRAMETLSAAETTLIFSTEPLWGTAFAAVVVGEQLGPNVALGAAFILSACIYSNLGMEGISNLWKGSVSSAGNFHSRRLNGKANETDPLPLSLQHQLAWFSSSAATSWAWWKVAASNIATLEDATDLIEETLSTIFQKLT